MAHPPGIIEHLWAWSVGLFIPLLSVINKRSLRTSPALTFPPRQKIRFYRTNSLFLWALGAITFALWLGNGRNPVDLGFRSPDATHYSTCIFLLILFTLLFCTDLYFSFGSNANRKRTAAKQALQIPFIPKERAEFKWYLFMCVAAGTGEEIFFRGFFYVYVEYLTNVKTMAVLIPSFFFALGHVYQGWKAAGKVMSLSLLFGLIVLYSGSLYPVILLHIAVDAISGWFSMYLPDTGGENNRRLINQKDDVN
jgi:membrane protease YdiL (CAAX protease family)